MINKRILYKTVCQ